MDLVGRGDYDQNSHQELHFLPGAWGQGICYRAMGLLLPVASRNRTLRHVALQSGPRKPFRLPTPSLRASRTVLSAVTTGLEPWVSPGRVWMHSWL